MVDLEHMSPAGRAAALRTMRRQTGQDELAIRAGLRAENEDDDGYDPYSDYVDMLSRGSCEEPEADPWR